MEKRLNVKNANMDKTWKSKQCRLEIRTTVKNADKT